MPAECVSCFRFSLPFLQSIFFPVHYVYLTDVYLLPSLQPILGSDVLLSFMLFYFLCLNSLGEHSSTELFFCQM